MERQPPKAPSLRRYGAKLNARLVDVGAWNFTPSILLLSYHILSTIIFLYLHFARKLSPMCLLCLFKWDLWPSKVCIIFLSHFWFGDIIVFTSWSSWRRSNKFGNAPQPLLSYYKISWLHFSATSMLYFVIRILQIYCPARNSKGTSRFFIVIGNALQSVTIRNLIQVISWVLWWWLRFHIRTSGKILHMD